MKNQMITPNTLIYLKIVLSKSKFSQNGIFALIANLFGAENGLLNMQKINKPNRKPLGKLTSVPPNNVSRIKLMSEFLQSTTVFRDLNLGYDSLLRAKKTDSKY